MKELRKSNKPVLLSLTIFSVLLFGLAALDSNIVAEDKSYNNNLIAKTENVICFNGIYQADDGGFYNFLRFYPNGRVCELSTKKSEKPNKIAEDDLKENYNKVKESSYIRRGNYSVEGTKIKFSTATVDYWGEIRSDSLVINSHSRINNRKSKSVYWFIEGPDYAERSELSTKSQKKVIAKKSSEIKKTQADKNVSSRLLTGEFITEEVEFDSFDLYHRKTLFNKKNKNVANRLIERNRYNPTQINRVYIDTISWKGDSMNQIGAKKIDYELGNPQNPMWICLDGEGNVCTKNGEAVFVKPFEAMQGSEFKREGNKAIKKIYPCQNCSSVTGIKECVYVW